MTDKLKVGRPYSTWRISAYECKVGESGALKLQGNYVIGWYGPFTQKKLELEILPKLSHNMLNKVNVIHLWLLYISSMMRLKYTYPKD